MGGKNQRDRQKGKVFGQGDGRRGRQGYKKEGKVYGLAKKHIMTAERKDWEASMVTEKRNKQMDRAAHTLSIYRPV